MGLLQWCHLQPQGPTSDIAAVLFPEPVRVSSLRVFPSGAQPFSQSPETIAVTEPEAFFLDVFFNALPVQTSTNSQDSTRDKRQKNVLVPTRLAYAGGQTEFAVDMGVEYATRLIIFQGQFQDISLAIYGEVAADRQEVVDQEPRSLPVLSPIPLSPALDLANSSSPTSLVKQLLALMPSPAPLALVIRLMFCLKPEKEDWDNPEFPYVYSDLDKVFENDMECEIIDWEGVVQSVSKPLRDDVSSGSLTALAALMNDFIGRGDQSDDAYYIAKLLTKSACQQTAFSRVLLEAIDLTDMFNEHSLDETTIHCLSEAAANVEIARYFSESIAFMQSLETLESSSRTENSIRKALQKLLARIRGWQTFEDALTNPDGDFLTSMAFLKDISVDEFALGCWLECMLNHEDLVNKLADGPIPEGPWSAPPLLFQERHSEISHTTFIMFIRAFIGISTVLAMLAWSDSLGDDPCCERTLNILVVWQGIDGYRELLNHSLLLRQMTRRLEWIKNDQDDQRPKKAGMLVERLLVGLAKDPQAMLRNDLVTTVLALKPPFCFITSDEMLEMDKLARVVQDGLLSAVDELAFDSLRPFSLRRLRVLRVSIAIVVEELKYDDGEWHVLETFWTERSQGLIPRLVAILEDVSEDLHHHYILTSVTRMHQALSELLMRTADDLLHVISRLSKSYPLTARDLRALSGTITNLYVCADAAILAFSPPSMASLVARKIRQSAIEVLTDLSRPSVRAEPDTLGAEVVMRTILEHASASNGRDPVHHVFQTYDLLNNILPYDMDSGDNRSDAYWTASVFPKVLEELKAFSRLLDSQTRLLFMNRLVEVDRGEIGIGEWLFGEELHNLSNIFHIYSSAHHDDSYERVLMAQLSAGLQFCELLISSPSTSWALPAISSNPDLSQSLDHCISSILDSSLSSLSIASLTRLLGKDAAQFSPDVRFSILLLTLRNAQNDTSVSGVLDPVPTILNSLPLSAVIAESLRNEMGRVFSAYSDNASMMNADTAETLLQMLEWLASQENVKLTTLTGISAEGFNYLCVTLAALLPPPRQQSFSSIRPTLQVDEDELLSNSTTELPEKLILPLRTIENLLSPRPAAPSTPKGTKTPDILGVVISPPTALLRSPAATGLTKMYVNNDFRQLRQAASARLNTSRLPSTHGA